MSSMNHVESDYVGNKTPYKNYSTSVAWGAIIGGAFAAAAVSLILLILGSALGLSSISPWSAQQSVAEFTVKTAIWLIIMQWVASGIGGYLAGRLRSKWVDMHNDEVFFRDTAHGFLAWAVATILTAGLLASVATSIVKGGVIASTTIAAGAAAGAANGAALHPDPIGDGTGYFVDSMFRSESTSPTPDAKEVRAETTQILLMGIKNGNVPDTDKAYLANQISLRTGVDNAEATKRVDDAIAQLNSAKEKAKEDAEKAIKTAKHVSIYIFLSLLVGAFIASAAAALGGRHRDEY